MADITVISGVTEGVPSPQFGGGFWGPYWVDQDTGYVIGYTDDESIVHCYKTTDAGASWSEQDSGNTPTLPAGSWGWWAAWADWQTPEDTGDRIHVLGVRDIGASTTATYWYFDTATDTWSSSTTALTGGSGTMNASTYAQCSITKARSGRLYAGMRTNAGSAPGSTEVYAYSDDAGDSWNSMATFNMAFGDNIFLFPGNEDDPDDLWLVWGDESADQLRFVVYDASTDMWGTDVLIASMALVSSTAQPQYYDLGADIRHSDGHLFIGFMSTYDTAGAFKCYEINGDVSITELTDVATITDDCYYPLILIDQQSGDLFAGMIGDPDGSEVLNSNTHVYYKVSDDGGATWGALTQYSSGSDDYRGLGRTGYKATEGGRFMPLWFDDDDSLYTVNDGNDVAIVGGSITLLSGPGVTYPGNPGNNYANNLYPLINVTFAYDTSDGTAYTWEIRTAAGGGGSLLATGIQADGLSAVAQLSYTDVPVGTTTLYLSASSGALASGDTAFTVTVGNDFIEPVDEEDALAGVGGSVIVRFRYERRDRHFVFKGELNLAVLECEVDLDNFRTIHRTARFAINPDNLPADFDREVDFIAVNAEFRAGPGFDRHTIGLFKLDQPQEEYMPGDTTDGDSGRTIWKGKARDLGAILNDATLAEPFTVESGADVWETLRTILAPFDLDSDFPTETATTAAARSWPVGTPYLVICNDLIESFNYYKLYPNERGVFEAAYQLDAHAEVLADAIYATTNEPRMVLKPFERTPTPALAVNQIRAIVEDPARAPLSAFRQNNDTNSPSSIAARNGATKDAIVIRDSAPDATTLQSIADAQLRVEAARGETALIRTAFDPRRTSHEYYDLFVDDIEVGTRWLVFGWILNMSVGATMFHSIGRTIRLELEDGG